MLEAFGLTDPGCVRTNNEDCFVIAPELGLYIVADGMGGAQAGEHASRLATDFVLDVIHRTEAKNADALVQSIQDANRAVMDAASRKAELDGMGTTIVAALELPERPDDDASIVCIASVGDSRAYSFEESDQGSKLTEITEDQTWVNEVGRRLGLDDEALKSHPMRHVLTMAVGVSEPLRVNTYILPLRAGSQVLLCSDGLHGVVSAEILSVIMHDADASLKEKCSQLIAAARDAGGPDNITVIILRAE